MKTFLITLSFILIFFSLSGDIFAIEIKCPIQKKGNTYYSPAGISSKIQLCLDKRKEGKESSITEFYCPSGDYTLQDGRVLDENTIPLHVGSALLMNEIDEVALTYMCTLRELRSKDAVVWTEDLRKKIEITSEGSFAQQYAKVCDHGYVEGRINTPTKTWITNTESYPQSICLNIAKKKATGWKNMGNILMGAGIAKGEQNDKDVFVDKVKGKYSAIIDKFLLYSRIARRAISNLTGLPKKSIQR